MFYLVKSLEMSCASVFLVTVVILCFSNVNSAEMNLKFYEERKYHQPKDLTELEILEIAKLSDMNHFKMVLDEILIPRVVGTPNHLKVGNFIVDQMKSLGWNVKEDLFPDQTPVFGVLNFRNIIASLNPDADRYLVLACHYDSKYEKNFLFVGATDSAVPCAMMINLAKTMHNHLQKFNKTNLSLQFIFFDGEEAFQEWGPKDSIYGARHLAKEWEVQSYKGVANMLERIDLMVLLDLLGAPDPTFYSYFVTTEKWYVRMANAERRLAEAGQLRAYSGMTQDNYFILSSSAAYIEDDHIPFLQRDVNILHVIPSPFPDVWHTEADDRSALDYKTIEDLNKIFSLFVAEYLHVETSYNRSIIWDHRVKLG